MNPQCETKPFAIVHLTHGNPFGKSSGARCEGMPTDDHHVAAYIFVDCYSGDTAIS